MDAICSHCKHYLSHGGPSGLCYFNPPTPFLVGMNKDKQSIVVSVRPEVPGNSKACHGFTEKIVLTASASDRQQLKI